MVLRLHKMQYFSLGLKTSGLSEGGMGENQPGLGRVCAFEGCDLSCAGVLKWGEFLTENGKSCGVSLSDGTVDS